MKLYLKNSITALYLIFIFSVGYLRETIFLVINSSLKNYSFPYNSSYVAPPQFLYDMSSKQLVVLKWLLTLGFSMLFFGLTILVVHFYFNNKAYNKLITWLYAVIVGASFLLSALGLAFNNFSETYALNRFIIGLAQTPLVPLMLFVVFYFKTKVENKNI